MDVYIETNRLTGMARSCISVSHARQAGNQAQRRMGKRDEGTTELQYRAEDLPWGLAVCQAPSAKARGLSLGSKLDAATQFAAADKGSQNAKSEGPGGSDWAGRRN
jgi:hypothetical protein